MKISKYIKIWFAICVLSVTFVLTGCGNKGEKKVLSIPEIGMAGGYELESDTLHCIVAVDGDASMESNITKKILVNQKEYMKIH